jgi:hypothetical protein
MPSAPDGPTRRTRQAAERREEAQVTDTDPTAMTWGLFVLLETTAEQDKDLPDPEVDAFLEAAESEIGVDGLLSGWAIVSAILRKHLIDHANTLGCDCGSHEWLNSEQLRLADR